MKYIKKNHLGFLLSFSAIALLFGSFSSYFSSDIFREEIHNGGHFDRVVEKEIDGVYAHKFVTPTDNYYTTQKSRSMSNVGDIETVWNTYTGEGTKIAVIDDGFEPTHPEYLRSDGSSAILSTSRYYYQSGSYVYYKSYSNDSTCLNEEWDDVYSEWATHGTNTSSTAAAPMNNGGIVGIAPGADILALKIDMSFGAIKSAIDYAISQEVDVINMSLGAYAETFIDGYGDQQSGSSSVATYLDSICQKAHNAGIIVVAAAGNEATSHKSYPACNDYVIGVGALYKNSNTNLATFTNFNSSETQTGNKNVDILAPGYVYAAGITGKTSSSHSNTYHDTQGTSFSSPIVAGAACLWKEKYPEGTPDQFEADLTSSAAGIGSYVDKTISPSGTPLDTNIACGRLDVGSLMKLSHDVSSISISESSHNLYKASGKGEHSFELSATISPDTAVNKNITWSTSNSSIASISKSSSVSGEKITISAGNSTGNATITATSSDGGYSATCTVTVSTWINVSSFVVTDESGQTSGEVSKGHTKQLSYSVLPSNATDGVVLFLSSNEDVATVNDNGLITAKSVGNTIITGLCSDDDDYFEVEYSLEVTQPSGYKTFIIDLYEYTTLTNTSATTEPTLDYVQGQTKIDDVVTKTVVTQVSQSSKAYRRLGGVELGSNNAGGSLTLTISNDYAVESVSVIACKVDSSPALTINSSSSDSGSYNAKSTAFADCTETLFYGDLGGTTTLTFACAKDYRATIYKIVCEYASDTPTPTPTNYTVSFNANGGDGTMSNQQTTGSTFTTPNCTFTYTNKTFSKWALNSVSGTQYSEGATITNISANIQLFAIWVDSSDIPYYNGVDTSSPSNLETWLHNKISSGTTDVGYDGLWTAYASTDCKPGTNLIWDMYSDEDFECGGSKQGHSYSKEGDGYNREHTIPQSWFNENSPMKSDLFHVYPTDGYVNNRRSNYPHGDVSSATYTSNNGSKLGTAGYSGMSGTVFEVIDEYKGDFARSYFYFATRYLDKISSFTTDGKKVFSTSFPHMNSTFINQYYSWHLQDPVSSKEINRNNAVYKIQGNRNPYIDHPEWVQYIFNGQTPTVVSVTGVSVSPTSATVEVNKTTTLTATVSPSDATNKAVTWSSSDETVATVSNGVVTGKSSGTAVITVTTVDGGFTATCSVTVTDSPSPTPGDEYVLEFKVFDNDGSTELTATTLLNSDHVVSNNLASSASNLSKVYEGKYGVKLGSGSGKGSFTINLKDSVQSSITGIEIYSTKYSTDSGTLGFTLGSKTGSATPGTDYLETFDEAINASTLKIETSAKRAYISKIVLKTGSSTVYTSISANIDPNYKIYVADNLDKSKLTVTLTGDSGSKVIGPDLYSVSGFDSSKSGSNTITITYSKQTPNLTCNLTLTILANPVVSISATTSAQYYAGSTFSYTSLHVSATYANGNVEEVSDYTCSLENGHLFTYEETGSMLITISYQGLSIDKTISIVRNTYVAPSKEEKNISSTSFSDLGGSSSSRVSKTIPLDGINYYFHNAYYYSSSKCVSFGSENQNGGYMQNTTKFKAPIRSVSINYASGSISCDIKVSIDGNTWTSYSSDVVKNNNYYFVKIYYKNDTSVAVASLNNDGIDTTATTKYVNITGFEFTFDGQDTALSLTDYIMYSDTLNQCVTKFDVARNKFLSMSISEQSTFQTSNEYKITVARQRYEAWARSLGKNPYQEGDATAFGILGLNNLTDSSHLVVIVVALFSVSTLATFIYIKKKRMSK